MKETVKDRLLAFIEYKGMTVRNFEIKTGLGPTFLAHFQKKGISPRKLGGIHYAFPELNINWLLEGVGDMVIESPEDVIAQSERIDAISYMKQTIAAKDELIKTLRDTIELYRKRIEELEKR